MKNFKVFSLFASLFLIFGMATTGCSQTNPDSATSNDSSISNSNDDTSTSSHEHTFSRSYEYDDTYHWHPSTCGHNVVSEKEKHTFKEEVTDPTYENGGYTTYTCSTCGYSYTDNETSKLEHNYSSTWSYDEYSHWHACTDKGYEHLKKDESSHTFTSTITDSTYEQGGYTTYTCSTCGYSYTDNETSPLAITVTWKNYDGTILEIDENVPYGSIPSYDGELPTKESTPQYSYTFSGWTPEIEKAVVNAEYYATYSSSAINYSISYDLDGGEGSNPTSYSIETGNITLSEPTKNGYEFIGWTGSNGTVPQKDIVIDCKSASDYSFTANWKLLTYTITYHLFEGENNIKNPETYTIEDTITLNPAKKDFYNFEGWYLDANFKNQITSLNGLYGNLNLYARFTPQVFKASFNLSDDNYYTITYTLDGKTSDKVVKIYPHDSYNIYDYIPRKTNYIFDGWYDESGECINANSQLVQDIVLHPMWVERKYTHTNSIGYDKYLTSPDENGNNKDIYANIAYPDTKNEYRYFYIPNYFNGLTTIRPQGVMINQSRATQTLSAQFSIEDLTSSEYFGPYKYSAKVGPNDTQGIIPLSSKIEFQPTPGHFFKIEISESSHNDGYMYLNINCNYNSPVPNIISTNNDIFYKSELSTSVPHRDGYDFAGWYDENDELIHDIWDYTSDKSFHAEWTLHEYKINYDLNGGINKPSNPSSFYCTDNIDFLPPSKDGYTFDGWYSDPDFSNKITSIQSGELYSDINLYAKWIANTYTVTLDYDGGQLCPVVEFYSEDSLIKSVPLFKDKVLDYFVPESSNPSLVFAGWYTDPEFKNGFSFEGKIDADLKLYAKWVSIENQYANFGNDVEVTINGKDERYIEVVCLEDQTIEISSSSDLDLYGAIYDENMNLIISNDDISDTDLDFSLIANLEAGHKYYILYRANQANVQGSAVINIGGKQIPDSCITGNYNVVVDKISVTYGEPFTLPKPYKEGYEFIGWFDENGNPIDASSWNYLDDTTIYAYWSKI